MLAGVARRLKRGIDEGMNPGEVFSRVQDHVIAAARAHVERLVLEAFVEKAAVAGRRRPQGRPQPALRPARAVDDRGRPGLVHGARPADRASARRRSAARSPRCAARSGRSPRTSSTRSAYPSRCCGPRDLIGGSTCALPGVGHASSAAGSERPALGDVLRLDRRAPAGGGALWRVSGIGSDLRRLYAAAAEIGRQPAGRPGARRAVRRRGGAARAATRPGRRVRRRRHLPDDARPDRWRPPGRGGRRPGDAADRRRRGPAVRGRQPSTWSSPSPACTASPTRRARSWRWRGCSRPGGVITGSALLNDTGMRFEPMRRAGRLRRAARPGVHVRPGPALAGRQGVARRDARQSPARSSVSFTAWAVKRRPPRALSARRCSFAA